MKGARSQTTPHTRTTSLIWLQGLLCGALVTLATPVAVVLVMLLLPVIGAVMLDRLPGKPRARTAFLFAASCCVSPVRALWAGGGDLATATGIATDANVIGWAWLAAGAGWALAELAPLGMRSALKIWEGIQKNRLIAQRDRLREEWGAAE